MAKIMLNGYYSEGTCKAIQENMEGATSLGFHVEYVMEPGGECALYVSTGIVGIDEQDLGEEVTSYLVEELAKAWTSHNK